MNLMRIYERISKQIPESVALIAPPAVGALENQSEHDLTWWFSKVRTATTQEAVLEILDGFRPRDWTDAQRALMSQTYIRRLEQINHKLLPEPEPVPSRKSSPASWWQDDY